MRWDEMKLIGTRVVETAQARGCADDQACAAVTQEWLTRVTPSPTQSGRTLQIEERARCVAVAAQWARSGFAQVLPSEKLAASLMASSMPRECVPELLMPWPTWVIRLPPRLLWVRDQHTLTPSGSMEDQSGWIDGVWVFQDMPNPSVKDGMRRSRGIYGTVDGSTFSGARIHVNEWPELAEEIDSDEEFRGAREASLLMQRLVLGCVAELNNTGITPDSVARDRPPPREKRGLPKSWTFSLVRDVVVDCREEIRKACKGHGGGVPTTQRLIRGHWKPKLSARVGRVVHVAPYWRGPDKGPIATSPHRLE